MPKTHRSARQARQWAFTLRLRWLKADAAVWVGHELVLATWELDIVVIVKSQGETDVLLPRHGHRGEDHFFIWLNIAHQRGEAGTVDPSARSTGMHDHPWIK